MIKNPLVIILSVIALVSGCQNSAVSNSGTDKKGAVATAINVQREIQSPLSQRYAEFRKEQIKSVRYELSIDLTDSEIYSGLVTVHMELVANNQSNVTFDFNGGEVFSTTINGNNVPFEYNQYFVSVSPEHFILGTSDINKSNTNKNDTTKHIVKIHYSRPYDKDGTGLHRFEEKSSGKSYLYTDFQPYHANELFPHFDQPNLRTTYTLDVKAPADWYVVSSTRETKIESLGDVRHWFFPESANFASYIFSLHAGPFKVWEDEHQGVPLRLFAREEMAPYVNLKDWFGPTKSSLDFFNDYFDIAYPYVKYDQLILPDYNAGAMENVAAVTFTERYLSRGDVTRAERKSIANVVAHEAAHMWFGNLVTPQWWNGLWLNEAFATHMANMATATIYPDTWEDFYKQTKDWAYWTDDGVNTHPIELPVDDTSEAFTNFDGITYGKGSSVLRQLSYYLGGDVYQTGVSRHLKKYAQTAATMAQFISVLEEVSEQDLTQWKRDWLLTSGLNRIQVDFQCEQDKISDFKILQMAPEEHPVFRTQKIQVALYAFQHDNLNLFNKTSVIYSGKSTRVTALVGQPCPDAVYPNYEDYAYVRVLLDQRTIDTVKQHINHFQENITRLMLWQSLWDGVQDASFSVVDYVDFALANIKGEKIDTINQNVYGKLAQAAIYLNHNVVNQITSSKTSVNDSTVDKVVDAKRALIEVENFFKTMMLTAETGSDQQQSAFNNFVTVSHSRAGLMYLEQLLRTEQTVAGLELDQDKRWRIVFRLNRFAFGDYQTLLDIEKERDQSDVGIKRSEASMAIRPDIEVKRQWLDRLLKEPKIQSFDLAKNILRALFPDSQKEIHKQFADEILGSLPDLAKIAESQYVAYVARTLLPEHCDAQSSMWFKKYMPLYQDLDPLITKVIKVSNQENERCIAINNLY